jgi:hypothetical protein
MRYVRVRWLHDAPDDPVEMFSEIDEKNREVRKVERFRDGHLGYASASESSEETWLGLVPVPPLDEIASDPQFLPGEISAAEFERVWALARSGATTRQTT